ncbi:MAG: hypothetical protein LBQ59_03110 [Candidatus Peribacteria bacterium]|jgi:hypothetical protein|nr:hypothetical protein [Candidatus Peribacteria bacterium]
MKKIVIHILREKFIKKDSFITELNILQSFAKENEIHNIIFYESEIKPPILLNSQYIEVHNYVGEEDLKERMQTINKVEEIIFINTREERLIKLTNELRQFIGQKISDFPEMFNDKSIQRELLYRNDLSVSVNYVKFKLNELEFNLIVEKI